MAEDGETNGAPAQVWDRISEIYLREMDQRFRPAHEHLLDRSDIDEGKSVLDIGTGTGAIAIAAAHALGERGDVTGIDISDGMLRVAEMRLIDETNIMFRRGSAEEIPAVDNAFDIVLSSLVMMFVPDRATAAREIARVLKPGGRFVASVWAGPEESDIVKFQAAVGAFAPDPPVEGVGPGGLADPLPFQAQLLDNGIDADVETEELAFDFDNFDSVWETLGGVMTASFTPERLEEAKVAVRDDIWPDHEGPIHFHNLVHFIVGNKS